MGAFLSGALVLKKGSAMLDLITDLDTVKSILSYPLVITGILILMLT